MGKLNTKNFSYVPSIKLQRNKFDRPKPVQTTWNFGEIVPLVCIDCLPGETHNIKMGDVIRMSNPIRDIMSNVCTDFFAFFVPYRLTWKHWQAFLGENDESAGIQTKDYLIPMADISTSGSEYIDTAGSLGDHLSLPLEVGKGSSKQPHLEVSVLQGRAYYLIYNYFFRNQNIIAPYAVETGDTPDILVNTSRVYNSECLKASKLPNYFTKCLPYAQKGTAVTIPLGTSAPVVFEHSAGSVPLVTSVKSGESFDDTHTVVNVTPSSAISGFPMQVDLRNATAATIEDLKRACGEQAFLYRDSIYGTRYQELLLGHFGILNPDSHMQQPELIGAHRVYQNVQQVIQNNGFEDGATSTLGSIGAISKTAGSCDLLTYTTLEHGFLMIVGVSRHDLVLNGNGVDRQFTHKTKFDFYWPEFSKLGASPVFNKEIFCTGDESIDNAVFGYQEYGSEWRFLQPSVSGYLNPYRKDSLNFWNLATKFDETPLLDQNFIEQDRSATSRALTTGEMGPDFIGDFYFVDTCVSPVSLNSYPSLGLSL